MKGETDRRRNPLQACRTAEAIPPNPSDLIASIRGFGYTLPTALADLIDNSLSAGATEVQISIDPAPGREFIAVTDNGKGMDLSRLVEAMRFGTLGPLAERQPEDLGRFGLGMKTASLSQGTSLTVISKPSTMQPHFRRWDLEHVRDVGKWELLEDLTVVGRRFLRQLNDAVSGTVVLIESLDRASFTGLPQSQIAGHLAAALEGVRDHLGMVFHRFISEDKIHIRLGETAVQAWDPFLIGLSARLPQESLKFAGGEIRVTPYALPHHSRLTDELHRQAGGPLGWNKHQGFFIYRGRRLIVPGDWLNLNLRQEEHFKLARIQVDLPNTMDHAWHLNVVKSHVAAPSSLRDDFRRIAAEVRRTAAAVYRVRGEREAPRDPGPQNPVWRREDVRTGVRYRLNRAHPVVRSVLHGGCPHDALLAQLLTLVEETVPVAAMMQEPARAIDGAAAEVSNEYLDQLADIVQHAEQ